MKGVKLVNEHTLSLVVSRETSDEECRQMVVDQMLSTYPDAVVKGPAEFIPTNIGSKVISQTFTSRLFDRIAANVTQSLYEDLLILRSEVGGSKRAAKVEMLDEILERLVTMFDWE